MPKITTKHVAHPTGCRRAHLTVGAAFSYCVLILAFVTPAGCAAARFGGSIEMRDEHVVEYAPPATQPATAEAAPAPTFTIIIERTQP